MLIEKYIQRSGLEEKLFGCRALQLYFRRGGLDFGFPIPHYFEMIILTDPLKKKNVNINLNNGTRICVCTDFTFDDFITNDGLLRLFKK